MDNGLRFAGIPKPAHNLGQPYALYNGSDYMRDYTARPIRAQKQGDEAEHHFRLSVELKSVRIATIKPRVESILPNSFTLFEFPMKIKNLLASIESTPLPVEVVDISTGEEEIVGVAAVYLVEVMKTRPTGTEAGGVLFVWENYVPIHAYVPDSDEQKLIGFVRVMLTLEDRGGVQRATAEDHLHDHAKQEGFAAALELDLWLRAEQEKYKEELKEEETRILQQIEDEWRTKEQMREEEFKRTEFEYSKLKSKLEEDDRDITHREKKVDLLEFELMKRMESLKMEYERKMADANEMMERTKDDFAHKAEAERRKREAMGATHKLLADEISASERKLKHTEEALMDFRKRMESSPSALLQAELASLSAEKIDLQRKVDQSATVCKSTRQKLLKAYQELARLKNQALAAQQARIRREHEELESLRLHAMAHQQTKLLHGDKVEIMDLKKKLRKLKKMELSGDDGASEEDYSGDEGEDEGDLEVEELEETEKSREKIPHKPTQNGVHDGHDENTTSETEIRLKQEVNRLTQERDTLLSTGLYSTDDRVINIIQKALDLQTQRLRDELLKRERVAEDLLKKERSRHQPAAPIGATTKPQKPKANTIAKKPVKSKVKSAPNVRPK